MKQAQDMKDAVWSLKGLTPTCKPGFLSPLQPSLAEPHEHLGVSVLLVNADP